MNNPITIIGGGLAGLTCAIHLAKGGVDVRLFEKNRFPHHKVCGEYVSNEVLDYLNQLGIFPEQSGAVSIHKFELTNPDGKSVMVDLPLGGFGWSRYGFDNALYQQALECGVDIRNEQVENISLDSDKFQIKTVQGEFCETTILIGAYGKRSNLDISLSRRFIQNRTQWMAVKAHYEGDCDPDTVSLHSFERGYCGISKVENNRVNVCYLAHLSTFKKYGDLKQFEKHVLRANPYLDKFFARSKMIFEKPMAISQISFGQRELVTNHILMCGDSAGLIHPLCGNGMAMAIVGAKILCENILNSISRNNLDRRVLEKAYIKDWEKHFKSRLRAGQLLQRLLQNNMATRLGLDVARLAPGLLRHIISTTHGKPKPFETA